MGAQCVRLSPKMGPQSRHERHFEGSKMRFPEEMIHFSLIISDLEIHCSSSVLNLPIQNINKIHFIVQNYLDVNFNTTDFFHIDKIIRCNKQKQVSFSVHSKVLEFLDFKVSIIDKKGNKIEKLSLKLHSVCEGPRHHDHLLKEMKARIIYNLEVTQLINVNFGCSNFKISDEKRNNISHQYGLSLDMIIPEQESKEGDDKRIIFSRNPEEFEKYLKNGVSSKKLKQSLFRIMMFKVNSSGFLDINNPVHQICIPYFKFWAQDDTSVVQEKSGNTVFQKIDFKCSERIKQGVDGWKDVFLQLNLRTSKIYLEQLECLVFSQNGFKTVSPCLISSKRGCLQKDFLTSEDLEFYQKKLKKTKTVTYQTKVQIQKNIKQCFQNLFQSGKQKACSLQQLEAVQDKLLNILNSLSNLITQGEEVTNESIWILINQIIHRPELSTNYLYLIQSPTQKTQIGIKYYTFIFEMLSKIIICTTVGLTYNELKCIQKFIGYVYFRCKWVQDLAIKALQRKNDPDFSSQKLMEIGVYASNKSPSKSLVYDWELCLLPHIKNDSRYRQISNSLFETSQSVPKWAELLFNRDDDDLYYGLIIEILNQGQLFLNNQGRIMWEYFPYYAQLLSTFLGEMNRNKIMDYSSLFKECSMKLISNEKLLNNFVMFLFPKTCLYETYCVIKCLELINSYFEVISSQNKRMPNEFNFNYFYTGIKCIFESNHSYLLIRIIGMLYRFYHIFSHDFKRSLQNFIFSKGFYLIFLHWCGHVRKMFYILLQFKISTKFKQNTINVNGHSLNTSLSFDGIQKMHQYKNLIQVLQNEEDKILSQKAFKKVDANAYHLKMKEKLKNKKKELIKQKNKSIISQESLNFKDQDELKLGRKTTQFRISENQLTKPSRRWSASIEQDDFKLIPEHLTKYIEIAMKEFRQMKACLNPDEDVKKMLKIFEANKSVDN